MMAENYSVENGQEHTEAVQNPNGGIASETQGRETQPDLYESDVFGKVIKRKKNDIWKRGKMKRIRHRDEDE